MVCSTAHAHRQAAAMEQRVQRAVDELQGLNQRKQGKKRLTARELRPKPSRSWRGTG